MASVTLAHPVPTRVQISAVKFGQWLELQRAGRSFEWVAIQVRPHVKAVGLKVDRSLIKKIEKGRVPGWPMLAALSRVYGVPIEETMRQLVAALEFPGAEALLHADDELGMPPTERDSAHVRDRDSGMQSFEDQDLPATDHHAPSAVPHDEPVLASTRAQLDRAIAELLAVSKQLARGQTAMGRVSRSGAARRPRKDRRQRDRQREADATKKR